MWQSLPRISPPLSKFNVEHCSAFVLVAQDGVSLDFEGLQSSVHALPEMSVAMVRNRMFDV